MSNNITHEGWKNYETWNCALHINQDYALYLSATIFMKHYKGAMPYRDWIKIAGLQNGKTADNCKWISNKLAYSELNDMMRGLV